jgi:molecular chaperone GrpE
MTDETPEQDRSATPPPGTQPGGTAAPSAEPQAEPQQAAPASAAPPPPTSLLGKAIAELRESQRSLHDRMLRIAADFDNFKKRSRKEQLDAVRRSEDKVVLGMLPVLDNLERGLAHAEGSNPPAAASSTRGPGSASDGGLAEGVRMVHKQFLAALEQIGVKPFSALGCPFDPERHEAIQQANSEQPPGTVCQELQRGYLRGERLLRPALVVVSLGPAVQAGTAAAEPRVVAAEASAAAAEPVAAEAAQPEEPAATEDAGAAKTE